MGFSTGFELDTMRVHQLQSVTVDGRVLATSRAALPVQLFSETEMSALNAINVTDVAKHFAGVTLKDYGGIGGLKTVSLRGLGAHYTGVSYDGMMMSDVQSGQIDLGRFHLENIDEISLSNAQPNDIFQSARAFSSGGVLNLRTKFIDHSDADNFQGKAYLKTGSFGLLNAGLFTAYSPFKRWAFNLSVDALKANGEYTFLQYYGNKFNLSEELIRQNTDVKSLRSEVNGRYLIRQNEQFVFKVNSFLSERGLPGNVTYYNTESSRQRLADNALLAQMQYINRVSSKFQHQYFAKFNSASNHFTDEALKYPGGLLDDKYLQREYYLSSSFKLQLLEGFDLSASTDWWYNDLNIESNVNFRDFSFPTRLTGMGNVATKFIRENITLSANLLYTLTREDVQSGTAAPDRNKLSPAFSISYKLLSEKELRLRAFYKNIYRLPTFNDLYYQKLGNSNLRPESANQFNVGLTYTDRIKGVLDEMSFTADAYYNDVTDKIIAVPRDMFHWSMTNKGKVSVKGLDVSARLAKDAGDAGRILLMSAYTLLHAVDATPGSDNFGEQIPYTPVHSGSSSLSYLYKSVQVGYNLIYSGVRWSGQTTQRTNKLYPYAEHSVFANVSYKKNKLNAELINLFNTQYEVVKFYPMPRRNFRVTYSLEF